MNLEQRDLVEFHVVTLTSAPGPHPCVLISNEDTYLAEGYFYAVMLSTKSYGEEFEYEVRPNMVTHETETVSYAKTQIIV